MTIIPGVNVMFFKVLNNNSSRDQGRKTMGYTLRQWALLFSIILFIVTAMLTTFAILGLIKTEYGWKLIKLDIAEEELNNEISSGKYNEQTNSNEMKLCFSMQSELMRACVLYLFSWTGILNLFAAMLLLYGILIRSYAYVVPWILISGITFIMVTFTAFVVHLGNFHEISINDISFAIAVITFGVFMGIWYTILLYCRTLIKVSCQMSSQPTAIKAYGGYTHTLKTMQKQDKKQII